VWGWEIRIVSCKVLINHALHLIGALKIIPGPVFTKLFRIRIKIRLKLKNLLICTFLKPTIII